MPPHDRRRCFRPSGRYLRASWPGLRADYSWLPPFEGASSNGANRLKVVFSAHPRVALEMGGATYDVAADAGASFVIGSEPTTLLRVPEVSDTLDIFPDMAFLRSCAGEVGIGDFSLNPTLTGRRRVTFRRDARLLAMAHRLRLACVGTAALSDIEASTWLLQLARWILETQHGRPPREDRRDGYRLDRRQLARVTDYVEVNVTRSLSLSDMAAVAGLSLFHFARCFKASTGMAPHRYVAARRMEAAKRYLLEGAMTVEEVVWEIGYANVGHFRRQFRAQLGVGPGSLRASAA